MSSYTSSGALGRAFLPTARGRRRLLALVLNFLLIAGMNSYAKRVPFSSQLPVLTSLIPSELAACLMTVGAAYVYIETGLAGVVLFSIVLITFQYLLGALLLSQERAGTSWAGSTSSAGFQVGILTAFIRTLDSRDKRTARHSSAVAAYSLRIAKRQGSPRAIRIWFSLPDSCMTSASSSSPTGSSRPTNHSRRAIGS